MMRSKERKGREIRLEIKVKSPQVILRSLKSVMGKALKLNQEILFEALLCPLLTLTSGESAYLSGVVSSCIKLRDARRPLQLKKVLARQNAVKRSYRARERPEGRKIWAR